MATILLAEDVEIVRTVLRRFVESNGHEVTECEGGDEARRLVAVTNFDVVVTDLWMKNGNGVEFIADQSMNSQSRPIIAMTGGDPSNVRGAHPDQAGDEEGYFGSHRPRRWAEG